MIVLLLPAAAFAQDSPIENEFLGALVGSWDGTARTWFQPGKLADESQVKGEC